jgi:hypothetical protein
MAKRAAAFESVSLLFRWRPGRQGTGYRKMLLAEGKCWDCYLIDYPPGAGVPDHRDPVPGKQHHRLNITVWGDPRRFAAQTDIVAQVRDEFELWLGQRIVRFRPDHITHSVRPSLERRLVLSIGWVR